MTDQEPSYRYDFGNLELTASQVMSLHFRPIFLFGGVAVVSRSIKEIDFQMPLEVESFEQGVAWIAYGIGQGFESLKPCPWYSQGWEWQEHLPCARDRKAYLARPQCSVDRDWFRIAVKKLHRLIDSAGEGDLALFEFDGEVLRITACNQVLAMPAHGEAWKEQYAISAKKLDFLPKRLMDKSIHLSVWYGRLSIGKRSWHLVTYPISAMVDPVKTEK